MSGRHDKNLCDLWISRIATKNLCQMSHQNNPKPKKDENNKEFEARSTGPHSQFELLQALPPVGVTRKPDHCLCLSGLLSVELEQVSDDPFLVTAEVDAISSFDRRI